MTITGQLDVTLDLPMPQSPDAERAVLGSILINNNVLFRIDLSADEFFKDAHRSIFRVIAEMAEERVDIEPLTLKEELARRGLLEQVGGVVYISSLLDMVPDVANVERYAAIVRRMAKKRAGILLGNVMMRAHLDPESEPEDVATAAMASLSPQATREDRQARPLAEVLADAYASQRALADANLSVAYDCGFPTLNEHKVFYPTFIVITADRGQGKSALMTALSANLAGNGHPNVMLSLESAPKEIGLRYAAMTTGIQHGYLRDMREPVFTAAHHAKMRDCIRTAGNLKVFIGRDLRTVEDILAEIRRLKYMHGIQMAFVDYIQLMTTRRRFERNELMYAHIADEFLNAAVSMGVGICAFSQVNKEGGVAYAEAIEKSARVRVHFVRPHKDDRDRNCEVELSILKNNEERTGAGFLFHFDEVTQKWSEGSCAEVGHRGAIQRTLV